jgi:hypothetical protein
MTLPDSCEGETMARTRRPQVTRQILESLTQAHGRMEADDLTDLPEDEADGLIAAGQWINQMWQFFSDDERLGEAEAVDAQRRTAHG